MRHTDNYLRRGGSDEDRVVGTIHLWVVGGVKSGKLKWRLADDEQIIGELVVEGGVSGLGHMDHLFSLYIIN